MKRDHRDHCIEQLADELEAMTAQAAGYRLVALQAIQRLHELHVELTRAREQHLRVVEEFRRWRGIGAEAA